LFDIRYLNIAAVSAASIQWYLVGRAHPLAKRSSSEALLQRSAPPRAKISGISHLIIKKRCSTNEVLLKRSAPQAKRSSNEVLLKRSAPLSSHLLSRPFTLGRTPTPA